MVQSAPGEPPKSHSALGVFKMVQARELIFCVDCGEGFQLFSVPGMSSERAPPGILALRELQDVRGPRATDGGQPTALLRQLRERVLRRVLAPGDQDGERRRGWRDGGDRSIYCASCVSCQDCGREQPEVACSSRRSHSIC